MKFLSLFVLLALAAGLVAGMAIGAAGNPSLDALADVIKSLGRMWLNALRMTVVPLVFALLVTAVASVADAAAAGRIAVRALAVFGAMLGIGILYAILAAPALLALWPADAASSEALRAAAGGSVEPPAPIKAGDWLAGLVPANPIRAAAEDSIPGVVIFALAFGFATTRLKSDGQDRIVGFFRATADALVQIVRWVLVLAPIGVFGLALGLGQESGLAGAGALIRYIGIVSIVTAGVAVLALLVAAIWGRTSPQRFAAAAAPVWALAISTQSSIACLPAMVERTRDVLGLRAETAGLTLPLAVALFRMTSPVANLAVVLFVADTLGIELGLGQMLAGGLVAFAISIGTVGLPGTISFVASIAPISLAMGVPVELLGLLVAVEVIPDIFRTIGNVTADMASAAIVDRGAQASPAEPAAEATEAA